MDPEVTTDRSAFLNISEYAGQNWDDLFIFIKCKMLCVNFHSLEHGFHLALAAHVKYGHGYGSHGEEYS